VTRRSRLLAGTLGWMLVAPAAPAETAVVPEAVTFVPERDPFVPKITFGVTAGQLGEDPLYNFHLGFQATSQLGLEATLAHTPSSGTHAAMHHLGAVVPVFAQGRLRPYLVAGLGTIQVFAGTALNADTVTKLVLHAGSGVQLHLRRDVALRFEARALGAVDQQQDHSGLLGYMQWSAGLAFHRPLGAANAFDTGEGP